MGATVDATLESMLWALHASDRPEEVVLLVADRLEERDDPRAAVVRAEQLLEDGYSQTLHYEWLQRYVGPCSSLADLQRAVQEHIYRHDRSPHWLVGKDAAQRHPVEREVAVSDYCSRLLAHFPDAVRTVEEGEAVTVPGVPCPECGGEVLISVEGYTTKDGKPFTIDFTCYQDDLAGCKHRYWQSDWMPVRDAAERWARAFLRVKP